MNIEFKELPKVCQFYLYGTIDETMSSNIAKEYELGVDVHDVKEITYHPGGLTAMNDGIGIAIDRVGKWLNDMNEDDRPSKVMVVIMTDGQENASSEYTLQRVKEMIKEQEEKYSWQFIYQGMDVTEVKTAESFGIKTKSYATKHKIGKSYDIISNATMLYRCATVSEAASALNDYVTTASVDLTKEFEDDTKLDMSGAYDGSK